MRKRLRQDTMTMIKQAMHKDVNTTLSLDEEWMLEMVELIQSYKLAYSRKLTVLACCLLTRFGIAKHRQIGYPNHNKLTKRILDGDYLIGMVYRLATTRKEGDLLPFLTTLYKKIQLAILLNHEPLDVQAELKSVIQKYLEQQLIEGNEFDETA